MFDDPCDRCHQSPHQLKVTSLAEASATPPTTGSSAAKTGALGASPRNSALSSTLKKGSMACARMRAWLGHVLEHISTSFFCIRHTD